jgi:hypothetical protein
MMQTGRWSAVVSVVSLVSYDADWKVESGGEFGVLWCRLEGGVQW